LPKGATPIDFAYAVHSEIGHHCVGAKVNGRIVPLKTALDNGDQVEIMTSKNQTPSPSWEQIVITGKARSEIRKFIHSQELNQYVSLGSAILERALKSAGISDISQSLQKVVKALHKNNIEDIYLAVGEGSISREEVLKHIKEPSKNPIRSTLSFLGLGNSKKQTKSEAVPIQGLIPGMAMHFAGCCHPLPGDPIVGVTHTGKGITIHASYCEMLNNFTSTPERLISLAWDSNSSMVPYIARLKITLSNHPGALASLSSTIAKEQSNITNLRITARSYDFFEMTIDVEVQNIEHMDKIIAALRGLDEMHSVERSKT